MKKPFLYSKWQRVYSRSCIKQTRRAGTVLSRYRYKGSSGTWANVYVVMQDEVTHSPIHEAEISTVVWAEEYLTSFKVLNESPSFLPKAQR